MNKPDIKTTTKSKTQKSSDEVYVKRVRCLARWGLVLSSVLAFEMFRFVRYQVNVPPKDFKILVTNFEASDEQDYRVTQKIFANLERQLTNYEDVKVEKLDLTIDSIKAAKKLGKQEKAAVVIWGGYLVNENVDVVPIWVNFKIIYRNNNFPEFGDIVRGEALTPQVTELESFKFQINLAEELTYLSLFTLGMNSYLEEDWSQTIDYFTEAIKVEEKQNRFASLGIEEIYLKLGDSYVSNEKDGKALDSYNQAIRIKPDFANAWYGKAAFYARQNKIDLTLENLKQAFKLDPDLRDYIQKDNDFDSIKANQRFQKLIHI